MSLFPTTQWGLVLAAGRKTDSRASLETLCSAYWYPLYVYARRNGRDPEAAKDLTQGFFVYLLEHDLFNAADSDRGRFRSFLKATFDHYAANERRKDQAQKRGAGEMPVSLDVNEAEMRLQREPVESSNPEIAFERQWARTLISKTMAALEAEMLEAGDEHRFRKLSPFLTGHGQDASYKDVARDLELSGSAVKVAVHRLRKRFGVLLREEVFQTVSDPAQVDEELRHILAVLGG